MNRSLWHNAFKGTRAQRYLGRAEVKVGVFLGWRPMVRMGIDVRAPAPSSIGRRLEDGLVFVVCHCVDVRRGSAGWREHRGFGRHLNADRPGNLGRTNDGRCDLAPEMSGISGLNASVGCKLPRLGMTVAAGEWNRRRGSRQACCLLRPYARKGNWDAGRRWSGQDGRARA